MVGEAHGGARMIGARERCRVVQQMEAAECGGACLAMVLAFHGKHLPLELVRQRCNTSRDGLSSSQIKSAAESFGLDVKAVRREPEDLQTLPVPMILHWSFDHFVVLEKAAGGRFHIVDPACGRRVVDRREFGAAFTGFALLFSPSDRFRRSGRAPSVVRTLIEEARRSPDAMLCVALLGVAATIPGVALSGAVGLYVDRLAKGAEAGWGLPVVAGFLAIAAVQALLAALSGRIGATLRAKISVHIAARGFWRALFLPLGFFAQRDAGELVSRLRLGADVGGAAAGPLAGLTPAMVEIAVYLAMLFLFSAKLCLAAGGVAVLNFAAIVLLIGRIAEANRNQQAIEGAATGVATSGFVAFPTYRLHGREQLLRARMIAAEDRALDAEQRMCWLEALSGLAPTASGLMLSVSALVVGAFAVMNDEMSIGSLISAQAVVGMLATPVATLAAGVCSLQQAAGALMRVEDLLDNPTDAALAPDRPRQEPQQREGRLRMLGVGFGFDGQPSLFADIDLEIAPGRMVALVGPSGSGKSTLARIAAGLVAPTRGSVCLDGVDVADWPPESLRREIQYVPQTSAIFTGTIEDNVAVWDDAIDAAACAEAIAHVGLDAQFARRVGGLSAPLSAGSVALSGGEIQRLALARALARRPKLLVLDETTSALDTLSEWAILKALRRLGVAALIVTHRAGTAERCDEIWDLRGGRLDRVGGRRPEPGTATRAASAPPPPLRNAG